jgi:hypothetical protein
MDFSLAGRYGQGKESSAFGGSSFAKTQLCAYKLLMSGRLPVGTGSFARSPSPDRAKKEFALCLCGEEKTG